jgi:hypothetical protein
VNQNQTYRAEVSGGYLWSPKRNRNGARNQFYENMREVAPGDLVLSFRDTTIAAVGVCRSYCYDAPKPREFGRSGSSWGEAGWRVDVSFTEVAHPIRPKDHIEVIRPLLPPRYSPLQANGDGLQSVYLAALPAPLAQALQGVLRGAGNTIPSAADAGTAGGLRQEELVVAITEAIEAEIAQSPDLGPTEKDQIIKARRGQGRFREGVLAFEKRCRITGVEDPEFLIASHIKPWRSATNEERLDGENGLLLTPNIDRLFDRGFIAFSDRGDLMIAPAAGRDCLRRLGLPVDSPVNVGPFSANQRRYLSFHRGNVFLEAGVDG